MYKADMLCLRRCGRWCNLLGAQLGVGSRLVAEVVSKSERNRWVVAKCYVPYLIFTLLRSIHRRTDR